MSPQATDLFMLRRATYYDWLKKQGETLPEAFWDPSLRKYVSPQSPPSPWGHFKEGLHLKKANEVFTNMGLNPLTNPKTSSAAEQYRGNQRPVPIDVHVVRNFGVTNRSGRQLDSLPRTGYGFTEGLLQSQASKMGLTPGQYQGALRAGGAEYTGLRSRDPMMVTFINRLVLYAESKGITPLQALKQLVREGLPIPLAAWGMAKAASPEDMEGHE